MTRSTGPTVVGELMAVDPVVIGANLPLDEAADILDRHRISGAPVVDRQARATMAARRGSGRAVGAIPAPS